MPSGQVCTDVVSSSSFPKTLQPSQSPSAQLGRTLKVWRGKAVSSSLTMSQPLGVTWGWIGTDKLRWKDAFCH